MAKEQEEAGIPLAENDSFALGPDPLGKMQKPRKQTQHLTLCSMRDQLLHISCQATYRHGPGCIQHSDNSLGNPQCCLVGPDAQEQLSNLSGQTHVWARSPLRVRTDAGQNAVHVMKGA